MFQKLETLIYLLFVFYGFSANAAEHYIREGASGSTAGTGDCSNWEDAHACDQLPATLVRGDTYYVADGTYPGRNFNTSGTALITIKKATQTDHGNGAGWSLTFGDGAATFTSKLQFSTSNWLFDGVSGGGPNNWTGPFGFRSTEPTDNMLQFDNDTSNITVRHIELVGVGSYNGWQAGLKAYSCTNCTLSYWYMHDIGLIPFFSGANNLLVEYGYMKNWFQGESHSELCSCWAIGNAPIGTHTFRYNLFTDIQSTGGLMWDSSSNHSAELRVYGNIFYEDPAVPMNNCCNGVIGGWTSNSDFFNVRVLNNSFINITGAQVMSTFPILNGNNEARNNLFYSIPNIGGGSVWQLITHNHFISTTSIGTHSTTSAGSPFKDLTTLDFSLKAATPAGATLSAPYNTDMFGKTRGADGVWDRGAVEFTVANLLRPASPSNVHLQ